MATTPRRLTCKQTPVINMPVSIRIFATIAVLILLPMMVSAVLASHGIKNANAICNLCVLGLLVDGTVAAIWLIWITP